MGRRLGEGGPGQREGVSTDDWGGDVVPATEECRKGPRETPDGTEGTCKCDTYET